MSSKQEPHDEVLQRSRFLPDAMGLTWLRDRLDLPPEADIGGYEVYRIAYRTLTADEMPRIEGAYRIHQQSEYPRLGTARKLYTTWRRALEPLAAVDEQFWQSIASVEGIDPLTVADLRVERRCFFYDMPFLNHLPENQVALGTLLREAGIEVRDAPALMDVLRQYDRRRESALISRMQAVPRTLDDMDDFLREEYGVTDENRDQ